MRIGVISDTHGLLRPEVESFLSTCSHIIHAGDVGGERTLVMVRAIAPASVVRGNVDVEDWALELPESESVKLRKTTIHVVHNLGLLDIDPADAGVDIVVYGHSHIPAVREEDGVRYLNPGSAGPVRFGRPVTYGWIELNGKGFEMGIETL